MPQMPTRAFTLAALALASHAATAQGQAAAAEAAMVVMVVGQTDRGVGLSDAATQGTVRAADIERRPAMRPGDLLEFVPGMVVTQHSGDGKANQYFLRGFNLDHGTDFATRVDGIPVNMPSHGHGQGYTDLNFVIPELVQRMHYRKGPYFAQDGDFATAGAADIEYRRAFDSPFAQLSVGGHGYRRGLLGASATVAPGIALLGALELMGNDGPWTVPEGLRRVNAVLGASGGDRAQGWQASLMAYDARWTATDQVPQRLLDAGQLQGRTFGRFDSLDPTDGGSTARYSLSGQWHRLGDATSSRISAYAMRYRLALYSNFSYQRDRGADGDQFAQQDSRSVYGLSASHAVGHTLAGLPARSEWGLQLRHDRIHAGLSDSVARQISGITRDDRIRQTDAGIYGQTAVEWTPWLRTVLGLRGDRLVASVAGPLAANAGTAGQGQWSPKLSVVAGPFSGTEFYFNAGRGFHSNDARGATTTVDARSGQAVIPVPALAAARGAEVGLRSQALAGWRTSLALWQLASESELVYLGDSGTTEARPGSRRRGVEFNNRWTLQPWLLLDADLAWTHARLDGGRRIPNAVDKVASLSATVADRGPWSASLQWRYLGSGALVEDNSLRSRSAASANLRLSWRLPAPTRDGALTLDLFNLFDRPHDDIQYAYASRLPGEAAPVFDRHVHPAEPRSLRVTLRLGF